MSFGGGGEWVVEEGGKKVEQRRSAGLFGCNWLFGRNKQSKKSFLEEDEGLEEEEEIR